MRTIVVFIFLIITRSITVIKLSLDNLLKEFNLEILKDSRISD